MALFVVKLNDDSKGRLNQYAQDMLKSGGLTDCVLRSLCDADDSDADNIEVECHSLVLGAYSSYFRRFFGRGLFAKRRDAVKMICLDVRSSVLQQMIHLIYFGQCSVSEYDILELQSTLQKFKIDHSVTGNGQTVHQEMKNITTNQLKRRLTAEPTLNDGPLASDSLNNDLSDDTKFKNLISHLPLLSDMQPEMLDNNDMSADAEQRHICKICGKVYQYDISLNKHLKTAHRTQP